MAKEACDILQDAHEGTSIVKSSRLQMLTLEFEQPIMRDDNYFKNFFAKLSDITNSTDTLGKKYSKCKIVKKIIISLFNRLHPKVVVIEKSKNIESMKVEELAGSLMTYKLHLHKR